MPFFTDSIPVRAGTSILSPMLSWMSLVRIGGALTLAYLAVVAWFWFYEDSFIYHADRDAYTEPPAFLDLPRRQVALTTSDAIPVAAWEMPPPASVPADSAPWLLYCHGNGGNIGNPGYHEAWSMLRRLGLGILAVEYRGYGESGGRPSEQGLYRDAEAAYRHLRETLGVPPERIILYGFSLGSAVAIELATRFPAAALVVEGAFQSIPARGRELYPWLPVSLIARNRYASIDKVAALRLPKLFIHSRDDEVNPFSHGQALHARSAEPKAFLEVNGPHAEAYRLDARFMTGVSAFLAGLGFPPPKALAVSP